MPRKTFSLPYERIAADDNEGICRSCGHVQGGCEPDARFYECESCGKSQVFGLSEALFEGFLTVGRDTSNDEPAEHNPHEVALANEERRKHQEQIDKLLDADELKRQAIRDDREARAGGCETNALSYDYFRNAKNA